MAVRPCVAGETEHCSSHRRGCRRSGKDNYLFFTHFFATSDHCGKVCSLEVMKSYAIHLVSSRHHFAIYPVLSLLRRAAVLRAKTGRIYYYCCTAHLRNLQRRKTVQKTKQGVSQRVPRVSLSCPFMIDRWKCEVVHEFRNEDPNCASLHPTGFQV